MLSCSSAVSRIATHIHFCACDAEATSTVAPTYSMAPKDYEAAVKPKPKPKAPPPFPRAWTKFRDLWPSYLNSYYKALYPNSQVPLDALTHEEKANDIGWALGFAEGGAAELPTRDRDELRRMIIAVQEL